MKVELPRLPTILTVAVTKRWADGEFAEAVDELSQLQAKFQMSEADFAHFLDAARLLWINKMSERRGT